MKLNLPILAVVGIFALFASLKADELLKVQVGTRAPTILSQDVSGNPLRVPNENNTFVLLSFFRGSGCPICRLRFQELEDLSAEFKTNHIESIAVFEDKTEFLRKYAPHATGFTRLVADPEGTWYRNYGLEKSLWGAVRTLFNGGIERASSGKPLLAPEHGGSGGVRLPAEFLLDHTGNIVIAHYGKFIGDHVSIETILQAAVQKSK